MEEESSELDLFSDLSAHSKQLRVSGVKGIIRIIKQNTKSDKRTAYLISKRLIRGLGASNQSFRQGCFASAVGFFRLLPEDFDFSAIEEVIRNELYPSGNTSKQEVGEAYLGQILAYGAMIVSGFILKQTEDNQRDVFAKLFQLSQKRSYLHHASFVFMTMLLQKSKQEFTPEGFIDYMKDISNNTYDKLNYLMLLGNIRIKTKTLKKAIGCKSFFDLSNAATLSSLLKRNKSSRLLEHEFFDNFSSSVVQHPEFFTSFWDPFTNQKPSNDSLEGHNEDVKEVTKPVKGDVIVLFVCSKLLKECLKKKEFNVVPDIMNKNILSFLIQNSRKENNLIHSLLLDFCKAMLNTSDNIKLALIKRILFEEGLLNFDILTKTKTILSLTNSLSFESIKELASLYKEVLENKIEISNFESRNKAALICLNHYTKLVNSNSCSDAIDWRLAQLNYLLEMGYFKQEISLNREMLTHIQEAFLTSLGHRFPNFEAFQKVLNGLVLRMKKLLIKQKSGLVVTFTDEMTQAWKTAVSASQEMNLYLENYTANKEVISVLKTFIEYMGLLLLKEPSTAVTNIQDLKSIFGELVNKENNNLWVEVLTDLILNLLSKANYHHRHLIRCTFKFICPHLSLKAFSQIVEVLNLSFESEDIEDNIEDEDEKGSETNENSSSESENDSESDIEDNDEEEITANEKLRFELRNVLGAGSDNESIDLSEMDEDEGKRLDETLSSIFKSNVKKKKSNHLSKYQNQMAHFRTKIVDLLEVCTEVMLPISYWLRALVPLADLFATTVGQNKLDSLRDRLRCCIKKLNSSKIITDETSLNETVEVIQKLFERASRTSGSYSDMKSELTILIKFVLKSSKPFQKGLNQTQLGTNEIFTCFKTYLEAFFSGNNQLPPQLFISMVAIGWDGILPLLSDILKYSFNESFKVHKRISGLKMIETFTKTPQYFDGHLNEFLEVYLSRSSEIFHESINNQIDKTSKEIEVNYKFYSHVLELLCIVLTRQKTNSHLLKLLDSEKMKDLLSQKMNSLPRMKKGLGKNVLKKLCNILSIEFTAVMNKQKTNENACKETEDASKTKLLKRKKREDLQQKKKAKRLKRGSLGIITQ